MYSVHERIRTEGKSNHESSDKHGEDINSENILMNFIPGID